MSKKYSRREFLHHTGAVSTAVIAGLGMHNDTQPPPEKQSIENQKSVAALTVPKFDVVRVAFIGVGVRGSGHVEHLLQMEGVEINAICDIHEPSADANIKRCVDKGKPAPEKYVSGHEDYKRMLDRDDIDAVFISTPWEDHVAMGTATMLANKHAFIEVPAAITVDECWELVDTAEKTQKHCMMLENVCYGREELMVLNMCRLGVFGELLHGEAAYIHDLRWQMHEIERGTGSWRTIHYTKRNGNLYPTHGLGPICQYMNINRGDRLDFMSSISSPSKAREIYAKSHFPEGHLRRQHKFVCGDINTTIAKTVMGKTMMIQWDEQLPRPYTRHNLIQGTRGVWGGFPNRIVVEGESPSIERWQQGDGLSSWFEKYDHPLWKRMGEEAKRMGGHGGMDFIMLWRIIYCLRNGLPLDQDVYDAAVWSVIGPLSEISVANRGKSVDVPDFTRGKWKEMKPLEIVN
jgi:hypothetical protein